MFPIWLVTWTINSEEGIAERFLSFLLDLVIYVAVDLIGFNGRRG